MEELIDSMTREMKAIFGVPKTIEHSNKGGVREDQIQAILSQVKFPVILKREEGNRLEYSHYFIVCTNEESLRQALVFEGFLESNLLIQEYIEHSEQVYKLYAIGPNWYGSEIRHSIPHTDIIKSGE
jgi:glutathione synthase/RimK-type ligase-like ATP-grasp enzyme